ncbi:PspC domain-containing protein [Flavimarina sp. Hel_I_48]|uniref:PspC domain-containing protein n=1 Tax=Flavimarina sp. Hel_I_48 TaxID=1392488 RepID=UPI00068B1CAB|nr:PspC domain-containing protein [Flavimarina sp. Hel_I_48]
MNKTININLAGLFFHIDEDAYAKLQRYLEAIKRSFTDAEGREEIIQDIEARIAELFTERIKNERQVIGNLEVDQVIEIMGQPEDYRIDEDIFEDEQPKAAPYTSTHTKKLYRDVENSYLGGVGSGLGHYLGVPPVWIRVLLVLLAFFTSGGFALLYIGAWIFLPAAKTTAQKLEMRGEPVNIDNIQRKVKEGFDTVADSVKNADFQKYGNQAKKSAGNAADGISKFVVVLLTVLAKVIGILLIIIGGSTIVGLFIGLFTAGTLGFINGGMSEYVGLFNSSSIPFWVLSLLAFFAMAIPFFAVFYLGLKILVTNLKRMSWGMKITLIIVWLVSVVILSAVGIKQAIDFSQRSSTTQTELLAINPADTLRVQMQVAGDAGSNGNGLFVVVDNDGKPFASFGDIDFSIKKSADSSYSLELIKKARGYSSTAAREHANEIIYPFDLQNNVLTLPQTFRIAEGATFRAQELELVLFVPENGNVFIDSNSKDFLSQHTGLMNHKLTNRYLTLKSGKLICAGCVEESATKNENEWQYRDVPSNKKTTAAPYEYDKARQSENKRLRDTAKIRVDSSRTVLDTIAN